MENELQPPAFYFAAENNILREFTADNFANFLDALAHKSQVPHSREKCREIESRYEKQLNKKVKAYFDGKKNVIEFINF